MIDKPKLSACIELLQANRTAEFMQLVGPTISALIHEKPWDHQWYMQPLSFGSQNATWICARCKDDRCAKGKDLPRNGCSVPPPLTESPEKLAFMLRDRTAYMPMKHAGYSINFFDSSPVSLEAWWFRATPCKQILVCLLALDQIERE